MTRTAKTCVTGLVLSGGGVRGISHLGVLKAIEEKGIRVDHISGSSAGALSGAFYSAGYTPEEILKIISSKKIYELIRFSVPKTGLFKITGLKKTLQKHISQCNIEDLPIPVTIAVTNFLEGRVEYLDNGPLIDILIASASIPALFNVTKLKGMLYIDGGVMDNLPVQPLRNKCTRIIASYCNPVGKIDKLKNPALIAERAFHLAIRSEIHKKAKLVDCYIEPSKLQKYSMFALKKSREIFQIGYDEALDVLGTCLPE